MENHNLQEKEVKKPDSFRGLNLAALGLDFAVIIAGPLVAGIYAGRWFDSKYSTDYWVIVGILLAIAMSSVLVYQRIKKAQARLKDK